MRWTLVLSFLISSVGLLLLSGVAQADHYAAGVLPGMLVASLGCGLSLPVLTAAAVTGTTEQNAGLGSALLTSVQQVGGAVGVAVLVTLAARQGDATAGPGNTQRATEGFSLALTVAASLLALGAVLIAALLRNGSTARRPPSSRTPVSGDALRHATE